MPRPVPIPAISLVGVVLAACCLGGCTATRPAAANAQATPTSPTRTDAGKNPTDDWTAGLLDQAMAVASSPPEKAHAGVRSRLQLETIRTALQLDMLELALRDAQRIDDWRRGEALALAAQSLARAGQRSRAGDCLREAAEQAERADGWRLERLRTEIAIGYALLGDVNAARRFAAQVPQELTGRVEAQLSGTVQLEEIDRQCDAFDAAIATGSFDVVRSGVEGYFAVWQRVGSDPARSARAERAIRAAAPGLPLDLQIDVHLRMADAFRTVGRTDAADAELASAEKLLRDFDFTTEIRGALIRDVAQAHLRRGNRDAALRLLSEAMARYPRDVDAIVDIDRADYLRPVAEGLAAAGDRPRALEAWSLALEAGCANPNARPRAEDLCLTCLSMARAGVEPTESMRSRIRDIREGLKAPW